MRYLFLISLFHAATALAQTSDESPWVCVPTEAYGWVCGRGADAPTPRALPVTPPEIPDAPPGYAPPESDAASALLPDITEEVLEPNEVNSQARSDELPPSATPSEEQQPPQAAPPTPAEGPVYGIQLAAFRDAQLLAQFARELDGIPSYQRSWQDEAGRWYVLLTGRFENRSDAAAALSELPPDLPEAGAWVRRVDTLGHLDDR